VDDQQLRESEQSIAVVFVGIHDGWTGGWQCLVLVLHCSEVVILPLLLRKIQMREMQQPNIEPDGGFLFPWLTHRQCPKPRSSRLAWNVEAEQITWLEAICGKAVQRAGPQSLFNTHSQSNQENQNLMKTIFLTNNFWHHYLLV
jgi:hypothetical protein